MSRQTRAGRLSPAQRRIVDATRELVDRSSEEQAALLLEAVVEILREPGGVHEIVITTHRGRMARAERRNKARIA